MIFPVLLAKFLSAGAIAQAATGAGVAVVVVASAGAVGALPDPLQNTVSEVVGTVTPFELPTGEEPVEEPVTEEPVVEEPVVEDVESEVPVEEVEFDPATWVEEGPAEGESFGSWVSASAQNPELREWLRAEGRTFGSMVSEWAHKKGLDDEELAEEGVDLDDLTGEPATEPVEEGTDVAPEDGDSETVTTTQRGNGKANGAGNGNGNGKANGAGNGNGKGGNGRN